MREYTIVIEDAGSNYSAYVLDFDGCVSTGETVEEVIENMREAIEAHLELMVESGEEIPEPLGFVGTAKVAV
jgi:predicted RNase H-like HicB family nuclease